MNFVGEPNVEKLPINGRESRDKHRFNRHYVLLNKEIDKQFKSHTDPNKSQISIHDNNIYRDSKFHASYNRIP